MKTTMGQTRGGGGPSTHSGTQNPRTDRRTMHTTVKAKPTKKGGPAPNGPDVSR